MAVRYLSVGGVDNPYRELQQSVNAVGQIFRDYDEEQRRQAENARKEFEYTQQLQERDRTNQQRTALAEYNPNIGQDFRGIDPALRPHVEAQERTLRTQWEEANPNPTAEDRAALDRELGEIRASLASSEDVYSTVFNDVFRISQDPNYADAMAKAQAAQYRSRNAPIEQARANADAFNAAREKEADRRLALLTLEGQNRRSYGNNVARLVDDLYGGSGRSSGSSGKGGSYSPEKYNFKTDAEFREVLQDRIGSWRDTPNALEWATAGFGEYNRQAREAGKPELSQHHKYQAILEDVVEAGLLGNSNVRYGSGEAFAELLSRKFGLPDSDRDVNTAAAQSHNRTAGLKEVENILSSAYRAPSKEEQLAILNPQQVTVDVTKEQQRWVANAYYARWPELAKRNPVVMEQVTTAETASTPAGNRTAPSGQGNTRTGGPAPATEEAPAGNRTDSNILAGSPFVSFNNTAPVQGTDTASQADQIPAGSARLLESYPEDVQALANTVYAYTNNDPRLVGPEPTAQTTRRRNNQQVLANLQSTDPAKYAQVMEAVGVLRDYGNERISVDQASTAAQLRDVTRRLERLNTGRPESVGAIAQRFIGTYPNVEVRRNELINRQRELEEEAARQKAEYDRRVADRTARREMLANLPVDLDAYNRILTDARYASPDVQPVTLRNTTPAPAVTPEGVGLAPTSLRPNDYQEMMRRLENLQNSVLAQPNNSTSSLR